MDAPSDVTRPPFGKRKAFSKTDWGSGRYGWWYVIDHDGKVVTSGPDLFTMVQRANKYNLTH